MNSFIIWLPLILVFVLIAFRIPVCAAFISGAVFYFTFIAPEMPLNIVLAKMLTAGMSMNLLAIPFFITAGLLMNYTGITSRLMKFAEDLVGHMWGGMAQVNILLSTLMGGLCGSCNADAAMECKMLVPEMEKRGFNTGFSAAVTAASSLISPMIPPGVMLILYASITENSVIDMFMAGYIPGILMCVAMMITVTLVSHRDGYKPTKEKRTPLPELLKSFVECFWAILIIVVLIVGLRTGIMTATEGGAVLCVLSIFVGMVVYKELHLKDFPGILKEAFISISNIFGIIISATVFGLYLTYAQIPQEITKMILGLTSSPIVFLLLVNVLMLLMGMLVDGAAIMMIACPLLYPVALEMGIDPIQFGIMIILNLSIGGLTPPFGSSLYLCCDICHVEMNEFLKQSKELLLSLMIVLLLITFIPQISTFLPYAFK